MTIDQKKQMKKWGYNPNYIALLEKNYPLNFTFDYIQKIESGILNGKTLEYTVKAANGTVHFKIVLKDLKIHGIRPGSFTFTYTDPNGQTQIDCVPGLCAHGKFTGKDVIDAILEGRKLKFSTGISVIKSEF